MRDSEMRMQKAKQGINRAALAIGAGIAASVVIEQSDEWLVGNSSA